MTDKVLVGIMIFVLGMAVLHYDSTLSRRTSGLLTVLAILATVALGLR